MEGGGDEQVVTGKVTVATLPWSFTVEMLVDGDKIRCGYL